MEIRHFENSKTGTSLIEIETLGIVCKKSIAYIYILAAILFPP